VGGTGQGSCTGAALALAVFTAVGAGPDAAAQSTGGTGALPYRIVDGKVDRGTYNGYRRYNAQCIQCHGPDGIGSSFAPSLITTPLAPEAFRKTVLEGRTSGTSVMKGFAGDPNVVDHIDDIYAYLRARADGALARGRPQKMD
jgi:mono/diheme cytochrome c family protein